MVFRNRVWPCEALRKVQRLCEEKNRQYQTADIYSRPLGHVYEYVLPYLLRDIEVFTVALMKMLAIWHIEVASMVTDVSEDIFVSIFRIGNYLPVDTCYIPEEVTFFTCVIHRSPDKKRDFFRRFPSQLPMCYCWCWSRVYFVYKSWLISVEISVHALTYSTS
jgi:hypothetical protein